MMMEWNGERRTEFSPDKELEKEAWNGMPIGEQNSALNRSGDVEFKIQIHNKWTKPLMITMMDEIH